MAGRTTPDVIELLKVNKFDKSVLESFEKNKIDRSVFIDLSDEDLKELGIKAMGDRRKIMKLQDKWKDKTQGSQTSQAPTQASTTAVGPDHTLLSAGDRMQYTQDVTVSTQEQAGVSHLVKYREVAASQVLIPLQSVSPQTHTSQPIQLPLHIQTHAGNQRHSPHVIATHPQAGPGQHPITASGFDYCSTRKDGGYPKSLLALKPTDTILVKFHVLVPLAMWQWDDEAHMHVRFSHNQLGSWKYDCGKFEITRDGYESPGKEAFCEMVCKLPIDIELLQKQQWLAYKYIIYSQRMTCEEDGYEYLNVGGSGNANRCLQVPDKKLKLGTYHQYDMMAFPGRRTKPWMLWKPELEPDPDISLPQPEEMLTRCLTFYLEHFANLLSEGDFPPQPCDIGKFIDDIQHIFLLMYTQKIVVKSTGPVRSITTNSLKNEMRLWLHSLVTGLTSSATAPADKKLLSAAIIACCMFQLNEKIGIAFKPQEVAAILDLLKVQPDQEKKTCPDFVKLRSVCHSPLCRSDIADAVVWLCNLLIDQKYHDITVVLSAIPLYHFLKNINDPFNNRHLLKPDSIQWTDKSIKLDSLHSNRGLKPSTTFVETYDTVLRPLCDADPSMLPLLIEMCPESDMNEFIIYLPPYVSSAWLAKKVDSMEDLRDMRKQAKVIVQLLSTTLIVLSSRNQLPSGSENVEECMATIEATRTLFNALTAANKLKADELSNDDIVIFKTSLSLYFRAICNLMRVKEDFNVQATFGDFVYCLVRWLSNNKAFAIFGGMHSIRTRSSLNPSKAEGEIKLWELLLASADCCKDNVMVMDKWHGAVVDGLRKRLDKVPSHMKFRLFCILASTGKIDPLLTTVFVEVTMCGLDILMKEGDKATQLQEVEKLTSMGSKEVGQILGHMIEIKYPSVKDATFVELLKWELWPNLIQMLHSTSSSSTIIAEGFGEHADTVCDHALWTLVAKCKELIQGDITLGELETIAKNQAQMEKLCNAALLRGNGPPYKSLKKEVWIGASPSSDGTGERMSDVPNSCEPVTTMPSHDHEKGKHPNAHDVIESPHLEEVLPVLSHRLEEFQRFQLRKEQLGNFCQKFPQGVIIEGIVDLRTELRHDFPSSKISSLWDPNNGSIVYFTDEAIVEILGPFHCLAGQYRTLFFDTTWKTTLDRSEKGVAITPEQIRHYWESALKKCKDILNSLANYSLKLIDVDRHFGTFKDDKSGASLQAELKNLVSGVRSCTSDIALKVDDIDSWVCAVKQYWELCDHATAASILLELQKCLKLQGDFKPVEMISSQVTTSVTNDTTLESIGELHSTAGRFLEGIANDNERIKCLKTFANCIDLVQWIKKLEGVSGLQRFVTVAIGTGSAGEGDLQHDKLSKLRIVGSGFESLIFKLPQRAGYQALVEKCESLWEALKRTPSLPTLLETCKKNLDWYEGVKKAQGSVQVTSYGQMRAINSTGIYTIFGSENILSPEFQDHMAFGDFTYCVQKSIKLIVAKRDKHTTKATYSLDELRDLESKLVLIAGNAGEGDLKAGVEQFSQTLQHVCRIAKALTDLQQAGHVGYIGWTMCFLCTNFIGDNLQYLVDEAKKMEKELNVWKNRVDMARNTYYELNYFTMSQLLTLRRELGKFKDPSFTASKINPDALILLQSISPDLSGEHIKPAMTKALPAFLIQEAAQCAAEQLEQSQPPSLDSTIVQSIDSKEELMQVSEEAEDHLGSKAPLDETQQSVLDELIELGYSKDLVLEALWTIAEKDRDTLCESALEWCDAKSASTQPSEPDTYADDVTYSDEDVDVENKNMNDLEESVVSPKEIQSDKPAEGVQIIIRGPVDSNNPLACALSHDLVIPIERCVTAVRHCGEDREAAENFLLCTGVGGELFQSSQKSIIPETFLFEGETESNKGKIVIYKPASGADYMNLDDLALTLRELSNSLRGSISMKRKFSLISGVPNLIVTPPEKVLRTVLTLYMEESSLPLPTQEEVFICNSETTAEEVTLLWHRAINDPGHQRIFCLVHPEKLSFKVSDRALITLGELSQGKKDYRLVLVCSDEDGKFKSHFVSKLHPYRRYYSTSDDAFQYKHYLRKHLVHSHESSPITFKDTRVLAADVDIERSCVRLITSTRAGMGKSLYVRRMAEKLQKIKKEKGVSGRDHIIIPVHGPKATADVVMDFLHTPECLSESACAILHFDVAPSILWKVDTILFQLLILNGLNDIHGRVWKSTPAQFYVVEVKLPNMESKEQIAKHKCILSLLELLPTIECMSPQQTLKMLEISNKDFADILKEDHKVLVDEHICHSPMYHRVYEYLRRYECGVSLDGFTYIAEGSFSIQDILDVILRFFKELQHSEMRRKDPSWRDLAHFVSFLNRQLECCEESFFCSQSFMIAANITGMKNFVVKFMICMSQDFATSSMDENSLQSGETHLPCVNKNKLWAKTHHSYLFFNDDKETITFVGFAVNQRGDHYDPRSEDHTIIQRRFMPRSLYYGLEDQEVDLQGDYNSDKDSLIRKLGAVMGHSWVLSQVKEGDDQLVPVHIEDPDPSYVLTVDNVIKMLAIRMRFRCGIPVILIGETGCGKTRLIRYMCELDNCLAKVPGARNMLILKVHGGTTQKDICNIVEKAEEEAEKNRKYTVKTVLFFDEANTTEHTGLIKEIMCDRKIFGRPVSQDLQLIAACNPYRMHTPDMITKLESAGLGFYVKETQDKLGSIPLRHLVYRVHDLPPSMHSLVYDFGQLGNVTEQDYIQQIVNNHVGRHPELFNLTEAVAKVLVCSQQYMKDETGECSFVSLRDVVRAMIVFEYFYTKMSLFETASNEATDDAKVPTPCTDRVTRALILALSVCYLARLDKRIDYEKCVIAAFEPPLSLPGPEENDKVEQFRNEIRWCQALLLHNMKLPENVARNTALRENVFMMAICIELRMPLFLVGKPGSSKSLAKSIVVDSMLGQSSSSDLLKEFKQVNMISHQCSQLSTPEGVIEVFKTARLYQREDMVSVVVLDEVGLAEDSPSLPLKALHPLLEDGTEDAVRSDEIVEREKRVAFIGISNWALDPAKMNRGVMVIRGDPDKEELIQSAEGICSNEVNDDGKSDDRVKEWLRPYFQGLSEAYLEIYRKQMELLDQKKEFYGLRDFYSLIKMLYWMCKRSGQPPNWQQFKHAILRNFGGLDDEVKLKPLQFFEKYITDHTIPELGNFVPEVQNKLSPDCTPLGLIRASLRSTERSWHGDNRYLLFLTENYAAHQILHHYLLDAVVPSGTNKDEKPPYVLFGSSFPKDKEYIQVCRNINRVKICMETGRMLILLNLECLYESLYDLLNQYYIKLDDESHYVDLGLQTHRVKCRVDNKFKLVLIAEKTTVFENFPLPLINRLEKHMVLTSTVLTESQRIVLKRLSAWIMQLAQPSQTTKSEYIFKDGDTFVGFQKDTPAAVVFHASKQLQVKHGIHEESEEWKEKVYEFSQELLLQTATPDAVVRAYANPTLQPDFEKIRETYFVKQRHSSLYEFLNFHTSESKSKSLLVQVTTHSDLLSREEIAQLGHKLGLDENHVSLYYLQEFDTELDFSNAIRPILRRDRMSGTDTMESLLIIQCDSGHLSVNLLSCAKYQVQDERSMASSSCTSEPSKAAVIGSEVQENNVCDDVPPKNVAVHVIFLISLPRKATGSSFMGFQGGEWISVHIDCLQSNMSLTLADGTNKTLSKLWYDPCDDHAAHQCCRLRDCIQAAAASHLGHMGTTQEMIVERVSHLLDLIPSQPSFPLDDNTFFGAIVRRICILLEEREGLFELPWFFNEALNPNNLQNGVTFLNTLARKFDQIIISILGGILGLIDHNYNLDLIDLNDYPLSQLWLRMFSDPEVCKFRYDDIATHRGEVQSSVSDFKAKMPFSWLIKTAVDGVWDTARTTAGDDMVQLCQHLSKLVSDMAVGKVLESIDSAHIVEFYDKYSEDYIRMAHKSLQKDSENLEREYKLLSTALHGVVHSSDFQLGTLSTMIAAIHVALHRIKGQVFWFGQICYQAPSILPHLEKRNQEHHEMTLHFDALMEILKTLEPPLDSTSDTLLHIHRWLNTLHNAKIAIESILSYHDASEEARLQWNLIQLLRLFTEHVVLKHKGMVIYARRLKKLLQKKRDFTKAEAIQRLKRTLNSIDGELKSKQTQDLDIIRRNFHKFFMEAVSSLCFGQKNVPEQDVVTELISEVFPETEGRMETKASLLHSARRDKVPVIRSFVLQLLLQHSTDEVRIHLNKYFEKCCQLSITASTDQDQLCPVHEVTTTSSADHGLCLLYVKCFEDALCKKLSCTPLQNQVGRCLQLLSDGFEALQHQIGRDADEVSVEYLEGVAKVRFALSVVAQLLSTTVEDQSVMLQYGADTTTLLETARKTCRDDRVNQSSGPGVYLFKLIARQYGISCLNKVAAQRSFSWIIPSSLEEMDATEDQVKGIDPFLLYHPVYSDVCQMIDGREIMQQMDSTRDDWRLALHLALYNKVTVPLSISMVEGISEVVKILQEFVEENHNLPPEIRESALALIGINLSEPLASRDLLKRNLACVVVHASAVFLNKQSLSILQPFVKMVKSPDELAHAYLPTLPDDDRGELLQALRSEVENYNGRFYECVNKHSYFIGQCGRAWDESHCNVCNAPIGGTRHVLKSGTRAEETDTTPIGYALEKPEDRGPNPFPERMLSPASCAIMRFLMHAALMWASNMESNAQKLCSIIRIKVQEEELPDFFWKHLKCDLEVIKKATNKSDDDVLLLIHLILYNIFTSSSDIAGMDGSLSSKELRNQWEICFDDTFIQPILQNMDAKIKDAINHLANAAKGCGDLKIIRSVYEQFEVPPETLDPHLWIFRSQITLDHLSLVLQRKNMRRFHPILFEFLIKEPILRATQYLPDIVRLQQYLYDKFHRRVDHKEAATLTFGKYLETNIQHAHMKVEYKRLIESVHKAWELVRDKIHKIARLHVKDEHLVSALSEATPLEYLIPTTSGPGLCTTALVDALALTHNNFIKYCQETVNQQRKTQGNLEWMLHKVPSTHIHRCHLLDYEQQILPVVLSHCHYSLTVGTGEDVKYDLPALEKNIYDRFIQGKPLIQLEIPQVVYHQDVLTANMFAAVRSKTKQQPLDPAIRQEILTELHSVEKLRQSLDVIDIVLSFLESTGGDPSRQLKDYIANTLKMDRSFSKKACDYCTLAHIMSLWETLSVEIARRITLNDQEPFDSHKFCEVFLKPLTKEQEEALQQVLRSFALEKLLGTLYEFIETYIKQAPERQSVWALTDVLDEQLQRYELPVIDRFAKEFPNTITLGQTMAAWKFIVHYQEKLRDS